MEDGDVELGGVRDVAQLLEEDLLLDRVHDVRALDEEARGRDVPRPVRALHQLDVVLELVALGQVYLRKVRVKF